MALKATEIGKTVVYATSFDMSGNTTVELKLTAPDGTESTILDARILTPATPLVVAVLGTLASSTYMTFLTESTDFPVAGDYTICGTYNDATPKTFYGDDAIITVEEAC